MICNYYPPIHKHGSSADCFDYAALELQNPLEVLSYSTFIPGWI